MRKLCLFALPFCAAVLAACLGLSGSVLLCAALTAALLGVLAGCLKRLPVCLLCLGLAAGLLWFAGWTQLFRAPARALAGQTTGFTATVLDWPDETSAGSVRLEVRLHLSDSPDPKALLYTDISCAGLVPGDQISGTARFQLTDTERGERVTYYEADGVFLRAVTIDTPAVQHPEHPPCRVWPAYIARAMKQSAALIFPDDLSGLAAALLTGDKSGLDSRDYSALQRSGIAHIVAVSGLHLSFFAGFLALFFPRRSKTGAALTLLLVFLFAAVAGFTPSVCRAAFMSP